MLIPFPLRGGLSRTGVPEINWRNPLTRKLVFCVVGNAPFHDLTGNCRATVVGAPAFALSNKDGMGLWTGDRSGAFASYNNFVTWNSPPAIATGSNTTFVSRFQAKTQASVGEYAGLLAYGKASDVIFSLSLQSGYTPIWEVQNTTGSYQGVVGGAADYPTTTQFAGVISGATKTIQVNDVFSTNSFSGTPKVGDNTYKIGIGVDWYNTAAGRCPNGVFTFSAIWNRALSNAELLSLYADPGQIFIFPDDELFVMLTGAAAPSGITGTLVASEAPDTAAFTGQLGVVGTLGATEAPDTALINGTTAWNAALVASEAPDTALVNGAVRWNAALAATEAPDTALINGTTAWNATLAASEAPDTALINGAVRWNATLAATEASDTALINGATRWNAALAATEASDTALIQGTVTTAGEISGSLIALEAPDTALISGTVTGIAGTLAASEAPDTALINGAVRWNAALAASEAPDTALITGTTAWNAILAAVEASDTALIQGTVAAPATITGTLSALEAPDTALITGALGALGITGTLTAQEAPDTALINARLGVFGTLSAQETPDTALITGNLVLPQLTGILAATEAPDTARITGYTELTGLPGVLTFGRTVVINRW